MQSSPMAPPQVPKSFIRTYWPTLITFILAVSVWIPYLAGLSGGYGEWNKQTKIPVLGKTFINETVVLDGHSFSNCTFKNVKFVYNGEAPFDLVGNTIEGKVIVATERPNMHLQTVLFQHFGMLKAGIPIEIYERPLEIR